MFNSAADIVTSIAKVVIPIAKVLAPIVTKVPGAIGVIGKVAQTVFVIFNIFKSDEKIEDLGDRAIQAEEAGINRDKFEDHDEYMEALRNFDVNPERSESIASEAKFIAGIGVGSLGLVEKNDVKIDGLAQVWGLVAKNPEYFNPERIQILVKKGIDMRTVADFFQGKLNPSSSKDFKAELITIDREISPELSDRDLLTKINQVRDGIDS